MEKMALLEERLDRLNAEMALLRARVEDLAALNGDKMPAAKTSAAPAQGHAQEDTSEALLTWVGRSSLLQRISALCFLLVVALLLRTLTDNGYLDARLGSAAGLLYAALLLTLGWYKYRRASPLAPVFVISGVVLMYMVVGETHARFAALPSELAYLLIIGAGVAAAVISYYNRVALPILVGTLGMCIAGVSVDYPNPSYPALIVLLMSANALGFVASRLHRCSWLRWTLFLVTAVLIQVWGYKIGVVSADATRSAAELAPAWFLPALILFSVGYFATAVFGMLRPAANRVTRFDLALPVVTAVWALLSAQPVVAVWWGTLYGLTVPGLAAAIGYFSLALWLLKREGDHNRSAASLFLGGAVLSTLAFLLSGALWPALVGLAGLALWAARLSVTAQSGGLRLISYVLQFVACFELGRWFFSDIHHADQFIAMSLSAVLAAVAMGHYRWCLRHDPPARSVFFQKVDEGNKLCVFLLLSSLVHAYFFARSTYALLVDDFATTGLAGFLGTQSVLINLGAVSVMIWALLRRDNEMRNLAILITLLGGGKVFLVDLFGMAGHGISGFPLVVSVFSFGAVIAIESLILGRWARNLPNLEGREDFSTASAQQVNVQES